MSQFETECPHCQSILSVQNDWIGMEVECPACQKNFTVQSQVSAPMPAEWGDSRTFTFVCPSCSTVMELPVALLGQKYECQSCFEEHIAQATTERQCPFCGQTVKYHATICKFCKADLAKTPPESTPVRKETFIFICPECDTVAELPLSAKGQEYTCKACCETTVAEPAEERKCPYCGKKIKFKASICKFCKKKVKPPHSLYTKSNNRTMKTGSMGEGLETCSANGVSFPLNRFLHGLGLGKGKIVAPGSSFSDLHRNAMDAIRGRVGPTLGAILLVQLIYSLGYIIPFPYAVHLVNLFLFPLTAGLLLFMLKLIRREETPIGCLFTPFSSYFHFIWGTVRFSLFIMLWSLLLIWPSGIIAAIRYSMTYYIMLDHPEFSVRDAMKESDAITFGHKWKCLGFFLLFGLFGMIIFGCAMIPYLAGSTGVAANLISTAILAVLSSLAGLWTGPMFASFYESIRRR